ncbi:hypothetical protein HORIV_02970 [Vreelandella olivaria]|uniref:Uncharacterized protein n=1 Tax=Vreelandella olivaria TaxID=390919 RepID=A0ABM7GBU1_9GAMM|nr:hypothetical protein HORIV_02970 [Halomonas olivaria]
MVGFGVLGFFMQKYGFSQAALCIALILGPMAESNLRLGLMSARDDLWVFLSGPITLLFLGLALLSLLLPMLRTWRQQRRVSFSPVEEGVARVGSAAISFFLSL